MSYFTLHHLIPWVITFVECSIPVHTRRSLTERYTASMDRFSRVSCQGKSLTAWKLEGRERSRHTNLPAQPRFPWYTHMAADNSTVWRALDDTRSQWIAMTSVCAGRGKVQGQGLAPSLLASAGGKRPWFPRRQQQHHKVRTHTDVHIIPSRSLGYWHYLSRVGDWQNNTPVNSN